jgi:hypothetical protein
MTARHERREDLPDHGGLPDDGATQLFAQPNRNSGGIFNDQWRNSIKGGGLAVRHS